MESWDGVAGLVARHSIRMRSGFGVAVCGLAMGFLHEKEKKKGELRTWLSEGCLVGLGVGVGG